MTHDNQKQISTHAVLLIVLSLAAIFGCEHVDNHNNPAGANSSGTTGLPLRADCNDNDPQIGECAVGLDCIDDLEQCLPPGSECGESVDCDNPQDRCNGQTFVCEPAGCLMGEGVAFCALESFNQETDQCELVNGGPDSGCCDEDADCDLAGGEGNGLCNPGTNLCVECLGDGDCPAEQRCNMNTLLCYDVPCAADPNDGCDNPTRDPQTHACIPGRLPNCCLADDDAACRTNCAVDADCANLGQGDWVCAARPNGSYCVPPGFDGLIGCEVDANPTPAANQCVMCDDADSDGFCDPDEACDGQDNNGNGQTDEGCPQCDAQVEVCDGVDNNCDGQVDNVENLGQQCWSGNGACAVAGVFVCDLMAQQLVCNSQPNPNAAGPEVCDGLDNDCDGMTDENEAGNGMLTQACGSAVGACQMGMSTCTGLGGENPWGACVGEIAPAAEICRNAVDEDCDGTANDGCDGDLDGVEDNADNCPDTPNANQANIDSQPGRGDACFAKIKVTVDDAGEEEEASSHMFYFGSPADGDLDGDNPAYDLYFLTEAQACQWGAELSIEAGITNQYYGCNPGQPGLDTVDVEVNDVLTPNVPIGHNWVCDLDADGDGDANSNLALSMAVLGCPDE